MMVVEFVQKLGDMSSELCFIGCGNFCEIEAYGRLGEGPGRGDR